MPPSPPLRLVVLGATGVTGARAVPYLRDRACDLGFRWAIAGRSGNRLAALVSGWPEDERPEILVVDTADVASVVAAVERTAAVVNFAGPFARLAAPVIEACVDAGVAYVDVTGEIDFAAEMMERWHDAAERSGARIVQVCGFESLPFDLVAALAIERLAAEHSERPVAIDSVFSATPPPGIPMPSDLVSNGTFESLRGAMAGDRAELLGDPAALIGDLATPGPVRAASPIRNLPRWREGVGPLTPMLPSPVINPPVIQRSLALAGAEPVPYREAVAAASLVPTVPLQAIVAAVGAGLQGALALLVRAPRPLRRAGTSAMRPLAPAGGPRDDRLEGWRWRVDCAVSGEAGAETAAAVEAEGHPGYLATSRMTAEAALILADPEAETPDLAGYLTPAAALGTSELGRFAAARLRFR